MQRVAQLAQNKVKKHRVIAEVIPPQPLNEQQHYNPPEEQGLIRESADLAFQNEKESRLLFLHLADVPIFY